MLCMNYHEHLLITRHISMIQFISHQNEQHDQLSGIRLALQGGCRWIQLRMKKASEEEAKQTALQAQALCREAQATFIIDDRVELVKEIQADGVHLGKNDMPIEEARRLLGSGFIIGGTANTFADIQRLCLAGVDYIGCGPFRFTTTKEKLSPTLGLDGYRNIMKQMRDHRLSTPIVAIGGITIADVPPLMHTGISGIAVSGAVLNASDPKAEMQQFINTIH